jgi:hypothetical protein
MGRRAGGWAGSTALVLTLLLPAYPATRLPAQSPDTTQVRAPVAVPRPAIKPVGALWRSLLIPGWGQARSGRHFTGAAFVAWEGVAVMMTVRAVQEKHYAEATGSVILPQKRQQIQDWVVIWGFNHLFAAAEAFVSAHLLDFPKELKLRAGSGGIGVSFPLPLP